MNERINELFDKALDQAVPETWTTLNPAQLSRLKQKFAQLIVQECERLNREQYHELLGVIVDTEEGDGFDSVCLDTVKRVAEYLANQGLTKCLEHGGADK
mgnify:CR=1 FL=1